MLFGRKTPPAPPDPSRDLALVLSGGGARAAHQVGVLRHLARRWPELEIPILTGVSAGAINASFLAAHPGPFAAAVDDLVSLWEDLSVSEVFDVETAHLGKNAVRWFGRLVSGGGPRAPQVRGLVDTAPLRQLLARNLPTIDGDIVGIERNVEAGRLDALALTTIDYSTGRTTVWVQGRKIQGWRRPSRVAVHTRLGIEHVMASAALPILFPAVRIGRSWFGDGGVRLSAPLSPALHLGARRVLTISTRYRQTETEAASPKIDDYPPPAQILGQLMNSIFLDVIDQDVERLERLNRLLEKLPPGDRDGLSPVDVMVLRPHSDLAKLSARHEPQLPQGFRFLTRSLGTRETKSPDFLSIVMFQPDYLRHLIELGEADAAEHTDELEAFLNRVPRPG